MAKGDKMKKVTIRKKLIEKECCCCVVPPAKPNKTCKRCKGTGIIEDSIYFHISKDICFDGDTVK